MRAFFAATVLMIAIKAQPRDYRYGSPSGAISKEFGYGYNVGNDYTHGDSHGQEMGQPEWFVQSAHDHIIGYDSVQPEADIDWEATDVATAMSDLATSITTALGDLNTLRNDHINYRKELKIRRMDSIHEDNLVLIDAPFNLQLDLLKRESKDIEKAKLNASQDADEARADLLARMTRYHADREEKMNLEAARVMRLLDRAVIDQKDVAEVLYAMRLDWLQGIYVSGETVYHDEYVYDMSVFDSEFDIFTYDVGNGKGHGHTNQANRGQRKNAGFVVGSNEPTKNHARDFLTNMRGAPEPVDGKTRRYDRQTLTAGDYRLGYDQARKAGAYGYDQEANLVDLSQPRPTWGQDKKKPEPRKESVETPKGKRTLQREEKQTQVQTQERKSPSGYGAKASKSVEESSKSYPKKSSEPEQQAAKSHPQPTKTQAPPKPQPQPTKSQPPKAYHPKSYPPMPQHPRMYPSRRTSYDDWYRVPAGGMYGYRPVPVYRHKQPRYPTRTATYDDWYGIPSGYVYY